MNRVAFSNGYEEETIDKLYATHKRKTFNRTYTTLQLISTPVPNSSISLPYFRLITNKIQKILKKYNIMRA